MTDTCLIQLGRIGDLLNVLPIAAHHGWAVCCMPEYADLCRGISGVTVERHIGDICNWPGAAEAMRKGYFYQYANTIVTQLFPNRTGDRRVTPSYCLEEWERAGCLDHFGKWPLVFDRRDAARELALWRSIDDGRPVLLLSLVGISGPFRDAAWLEAQVRAEWGHRFNVVSLPGVRAERFYDLLGLYDRAAGLLTIDTSTLHLCWASPVPAIQLLSYEPEEWHASVPKGNCIYHCKYREARATVGRIHAAIEGLA